MPESFDINQLLKIEEERRKKEVSRALQFFELIWDDEEIKNVYLEENKMTEQEFKEKLIREKVLYSENREFLGNLRNEKGVNIYFWTFDNDEWVKS